MPDDLRKRIESLNRGKLASTSDADGLRKRLRKSQKAQKNSPPRGASGEADSRPAGQSPPLADGNDAVAERPVHYGAMPAPKSPPRERRIPGEDEIVKLEDEVKGCESCSPSGQKSFLVERRPSGPYEEFGGLDRSLSDALARAGSETLARTGGGLSDELERAEVSSGIGAEDVVFFDLETTGLGSSPLFLIGAMVWEEGGLVVKQYFARDYTEERAVLESFLALVVDRRLLVSFNGKSFDVPFVRMRAAYNGLACSLEQSHLDLLHAARRVWKGETPDCKLQTLEKWVCGRWRRGDIPGHLIPDAYHDYVRTKNAVRMVDVLKHNYLDLVTLAELMARMP